MPADSILARTVIPSPSCPCTTCRALGGGWISTNLQDSSGGSAAQAAASSLQDTPWWGRGPRLPPLWWNKETSGQPYIALVPDGSKPGSCNELSAVSFCHYILRSFSIASQKQRPSNTQAIVTVGKTQVCNLSKYNSVVPIKLKTEKWHKKNVHYFKLQFFICSLLLPHSLKWIQDLIYFNKSLILHLGFSSVLLIFSMASLPTGKELEQLGSFTGRL